VNRSRSFCSELDVEMYKDDLWKQIEEQRQSKRDTVKDIKIEEVEDDYFKKIIRQNKLYTDISKTKPKYKRNK
jgi:hypothetical protein